MTSTEKSVKDCGQKKITTPFYTQPSLDEVMAWWTDYCESRVERGEIVVFLEMSGKRKAVGTLLKLCY